MCDNKMSLKPRGINVMILKTLKKKNELQLFV